MVMGTIFKFNRGGGFVSFVSRVKSDCVFIPFSCNGVIYDLFKGTFRDHSSDNALNFHTIRDFCILGMVLDV